MGWHLVCYQGVILLIIPSALRLFHSVGGSQHHGSDRYKYHTYYTYFKWGGGVRTTERMAIHTIQTCLLYTSDVADDLPCLDFGGRRMIKKKIKRVYIIQSSPVRISHMTYHQDSGANHTLNTT